MSQLQYDSRNQQINKQLSKLKAQVQYWQKKYTSLAQQHNQLLECLKVKKFFENDLTNFSKCKQTLFLKQNQRTTRNDSIQIIQDQQQVSDPKISNSNVKPANSQQSLLFSRAQTKYVGSQKTVNSQLQQTQELLLENPSPSVKVQSDKQIDLFSIEKIQIDVQASQFQISEDLNSQVKSKKGLDLIEGYFILQKIDKFRDNCKNYDLWIKSANDGMQQKQKSLLQIIYRYTFRQQPLLPIQDDPFDSRVNQIKYGTPYQDLIYSFDNFQIQSNEQQDSRFVSMSLRKKFVHCLIRPEIIYVDGKPFQTEIIYGFVSPFPFKTFFHKLHRALQQQIKFEILKQSKNLPVQVQVSKDKRIQIISILMKDTFLKSLQSCSNIENYPIKLAIQTKVSIVKLDVESQQQLKKIESQDLTVLLKKYSLSKISKILHYVLTQKQVIIVAINRKDLNQILQIIRLMIKPFIWVFPTVYRYSDHFEPFLLSPMPLVIGIVFDFYLKNYKQNKILMENQLVTIFVELTVPVKEAFSFFSNRPRHVPTDLRQVQDYEKDILFLSKYLNKVDKKSESNSTQRICKYMSRLIILIQQGKIDSQLTTFLIDFLGTQMAQYYKDVLMGSNKNSSKNQEYGQDLAVAK